jgi:hypothetical protein
MGRCRSDTRGRIMPQRKFSRLITNDACWVPGRREADLHRIRPVLHGFGWAISFGLMATFGVRATWRGGHPVQPGAPLIFLPSTWGRASIAHLDISKGGIRFAHHAHIESAAATIFHQLANEKNLAGLAPPTSAIAPRITSGN